MTTEASVGLKLWAVVEDDPDTTGVLVSIHATKEGAEAVAQGLNAQWGYPAWYHIEPEVILP